VHRACLAGLPEGVAIGEGSGPLDRHVTVRQPSEVIDLADRPSLVAGDGSARAAAFTRLADEHLDRAYRLARAILLDEPEAQDAVHDAFVQAWRKWDTLRDQTRFEPWFDRILVNTCRDRLRAPSRRTTDFSAEVALSDEKGSTCFGTRDLEGAGAPDGRRAHGATSLTLWPGTRWRRGYRLLG
jgi:hypothetical protein